MGKVNFIEKLSMFTDHWSPRVIAEMNDYQFKLVKIKGDFIWHNHPDTDEAFIVLEGTMFIELENEIIELNEGEMYVVLRGTDHKPYAIDECKIMLVEPKGVMNTGNKTSELTASNDVWI